MLCKMCDRIFGLEREKKASQARKVIAEGKTRTSHIEREGPRKHSSFNYVREQKLTSMTGSHFSLTTFSSPWEVIKPRENTKEWPLYE